ncbi:hypothetical protein GCM10010520_67730 [Rhizobium viscosum]|uniref:DUF6894 domain-containing protein n=1 Tax=Rhizobium viscosum TaxID=1673 RepID=A0ABR9IQK1_RHIVS|nr:hypothetical protein [Rhizobium viscosum]MBE1505468.1 hypothetical protein [Rhizobium viscosum]
MSHFYFKTIDNDGTVPGDLPLEFPDLFAAVEEAKHVLAEMALDGLPQWPDGSLGIEVQNGDRSPIVRLRLELKVDYIRPS